MPRQDFHGARRGQLLRRHGAVAVVQDDIERQLADGMAFDGDRHRRAALRTGDHEHRRVAAQAGALGERRVEGDAYPQALRRGRGHGFGKGGKPAAWRASSICGRSVARVAHRPSRAAAPRSCAPRHRAGLALRDAEEPARALVLRLQLQACSSSATLWSSKRRSGAASARDCAASTSTSGSCGDEAACA
jgi:hypothetical protein